MHIARKFLAALALLALLAPLAAFALCHAASAQSSLFSSTPSTGLISPGPSGRGDLFSPGGALGSQSQAPMNVPNSAAPVAPMAMPMVPAGQVALVLSARFG
jgi:hypothetical protein